MNDIEVSPYIISLVVEPQTSKILNLKSYFPNWNKGALWQKMVNLQLQNVDTIFEDASLTETIV